MAQLGAQLDNGNPPEYVAFPAIAGQAKPHQVNDVYGQCKINSGSAFYCYNAPITIYVPGPQNPIGIRQPPREGEHAGLRGPFASGLNPAYQGNFPPGAGPTVYHEFQSSTGQPAYNPYMYQAPGQHRGHKTSEKQQQYQCFADNDCKSMNQEHTTTAEDIDDSVIEVDGQVWNAARLAKLQTSSRLASHGGHGRQSYSCKQKSNPYNGSQVFSHSKLSSSQTNLRGGHLTTLFTPQSTPEIYIPVKPLAHPRKFYIKVFAVDGQDELSDSRFRQWVIRKRGVKCCIAEIDDGGLSISFSYWSSSNSDKVSSKWFPKINSRNVYRICHDQHASSIKIEWSTGRTLYIQFRPRHYKSFVRLLGRLECSGDLASWARSIQRKDQSTRLRL
ncbi:uncharacterized protein LY89DRAFT_729518 [Mollisia scopiformis]|uniref:Uncharacterized protein n=1 Tax=Mollisia scopiformis TaxID=149040 RepID=A0A194XPE5_MOLSC|nr:uncharacterized protein LY89DRAFT_729518 [Mollisia scopiformis]KUJ22036.1 hypothetical protein LY89DRAFT_729518 [Mollisia scopiformis]